MEVYGAVFNESVLPAVYGDCELFFYDIQFREIDAGSSQYNF